MRRNDIRTICEAASGSDIHFVPLKTVAPQAVLSLHRIREALTGQRFQGLLAKFSLVLFTGLFSG